MGLAIEMLSAKLVHRPTRSGGDGDRGVKRLRLSRSSLKEKNFALQFREDPLRDPVSDKEAVRDSSVAVFQSCVIHQYPPLFCQLWMLHS